jgi:hypothetical protein
MKLRKGKTIIVMGNLIAPWAGAPLFYRRFSLGYTPEKRALKEKRI